MCGKIFSLERTPSVLNLSKERGTEVVKRPPLGGFTTESVKDIDNEADAPSADSDRALQRLGRPGVSELRNRYDSVSNGKYRPTGWWRDGTDGSRSVQDLMEKYDERRFAPVTKEPYYPYGPEIPIRLFFLLSLGAASYLNTKVGGRLMSRSTTLSRPSLDTASDDTFTEPAAENAHTTLPTILGLIELGKYYYPDEWMESSHSKPSEIQPNDGNRIHISAQKPVPGAQKALLEIPIPTLENGAISEQSISNRLAKRNPGGVAQDWYVECGSREAARKANIDKGDPGFVDEGAYILRSSNARYDLSVSRCTEACACVPSPGGGLELRCPNTFFTGKRGPATALGALPGNFQTHTRGLHIQENTVRLGGI
ncbi:hypothetical protein AA313_de0209711 [Arthrobotrys entomopaga]|nr:hypothetical protein AA313_de0209711 [Arthrobotrys entomopaga]